MAITITGNPHDINSNEVGLSLHPNEYSAVQVGSGLTNVFTPDVIKALSDPGYTGTLSIAGKDINSMTADQINSSYKNYIGNTGNKLDWSMKGMGGTLLSAGQLGLGLLGYLDQRKTASKQRALMDQQLAANSYNMAKTKRDNEHMRQIFNPQNV